MIYLVIGGFIAVLTIVVIITHISEKNRANRYIDSYFGKCPDNKDVVFESVSTLYSTLKNRDKETDCIDDLTWNDLDMDEVFLRLDTTMTSAGQEYLYKELRMKSDNNEKVKRREKIIAALEKDPQLLRKIQTVLYNSSKTNYNGLASFLNKNTQTYLGNPLLIKIMAFVPLASFLIMILSVRLGVTVLIFSLLINIMYSLLKGANSEMLITNVCNLADVVDVCRKVIKINGHDGVLYDEDINMHYRKLDNLTRFQFLFSDTSTNDMKFINELIVSTFMGKLLKYNSDIKTIFNKNESVEKLITYVGELDLAVCIMSFRKSLPHYCIPQFSDNFEIKSDGLYHPLLKHPVSNDCDIKRNSLITGSNASGKSTFIKAIAVNCILAQSLNTCCAESFSMKKALVMSSMAVRDNIMAGDSYFITETKSLRRIINKVKEVPCICFVDEILKGTNTIERIAASYSVLEFLATQNCMCIVASHDIELTEMLKDNYDNYNFSEEITDNTISFDYKLKDGPSRTRNAIKLLKYLEFDRSIIETADAKVDRFINENKWQ